MSAADVSVVVIARDEALTCGPTMTTVDRAVAAARQGGHVVETIVALDRSSDATSAFFDQDEFDRWERWIRPEGLRGGVRNAIVADTSGRRVTLLEAGDLLSENWFVRGLECVDASGQRDERVIGHPEVTLTFDDQVGLYHHLGQDSELFDPYLLYAQDVFGSPGLIPRAAHLEVPYADRDAPGGTTVQDWEFVVETMARGWRHVVVPETVHFRRCRDSATTVEAGRRALPRALPELAIDRVRDLPSGPVAQ